MRHSLLAKGGHLISSFLIFCHRFPPLNHTIHALWTLYVHTARKLHADFEKNRGPSAFINAGLPAMTR
jgi:hypothetical protein